MICINNFGTGCTRVLVNILTYVYVYSYREMN
jgi:hypothetical protein